MRRIWVLSRDSAYPRLRQNFSGKGHRLFLLTAILASVSTALAEVLGAAIGLNMLFGIPLTMGSVLSALFAVYMTFSKGYRRLERVIIGFVSLIGLCFIFELALVRIEWSEALKGWVTPSFPEGSLPIVMSILGAVVMPHNLFLHSEIIQSRQWNLETEEVVKRQLKYEFTDTLFAMIMGWAINSAMILLAASVFYSSEVVVTALPRAEMTLRPLLGNAAAFIFALALLFSGLSSSITAAMAGGSIFAGIFEEPFDMSHNHSRAGVLITFLGGLLIVFFLTDPFQGIIWSQIILSIQLPWTIFSLLLLTSSPAVMGKFSNSLKDKFLLWSTAVVVSVLNVMLLVQVFQ